jgi:hypothetical protein
VSGRKRLGVQGTCLRRDVSLKPEKDHCRTFHLDMLLLSQFWMSASWSFWEQHGMILVWVFELASRWFSSDIAKLDI